MIKKYVKDNIELLYKVHKDLCLIPAPSYKEEKRAEYCKALLEGFGAKGVYIDEAKNVIFPINCEGSNELTVVVAHTDTVFPDLEPMPFVEDGDILRCPGVGDDTASLAVLLITAKYYIDNNIKVPKGLMIVCNSCEEGLGNLKGTRQIFEDFEGRIAQFISLDSKLGNIAHNCAGSHRYEVEVLTEGGHSFGAFGNANAINELAKIVNAIYQIEVPVKEGVKTTYNVGGISGGTSVNTIAQSAKMLCEYRSADKDCLAYMNKKFDEIFENARTDKVQVNVTKIGDRPCADIDMKKLDRIKDIAAGVVKEVIGKDVRFTTSSTDCNIPLSLGVPAICIAVYSGGGTHTREEWIKKSSFTPGLEICIKTLLGVQLQ